MAAEAMRLLTCSEHLIVMSNKLGCMEIGVAIVSHLEIWVISTKEIWLSRRRVN